MFGTQKITMGRGKDTDFQSKKAAAIAQAGMGGDYMWGVQSVYDQGSAEASKAARDPKRGNTNLMTGDQLVGAEGNFSPRFDAAGNQVISDPQNQTGYADGGFSSTLQPQADPDIAGQLASDRVKMMAQGIQYPGLNNRQQIYGA